MERPSCWDGPTFIHQRYVDTFSYWDVRASCWDAYVIRVQSQHDGIL